jgi:hypothetical protein
VHQVTQSPAVGVPAHYLTRTLVATYTQQFDIENRLVAVTPPRAIP